VDPQKQSILVESIRVSGQQSPVLVRRISDAPLRYQLAYGHRRVAACRELGRKVLAIVRSLSDQELLVAQGQENSSRADLSYIERATFAYYLECRGIARDTIMLALATDKTELSRMISVARTVPAEVVSAVGPAPKAGRTRWLALAEHLGDGKHVQRLHAFASRNEFRLAPSDKRFEMLLRSLQAPAKDRPRDAWTTSEGKVLVRCVRSPKSTTLSIDEKVEPGFGEFLFANLESLYANFCENKAGPG
jgi:ParB family chromosome partitioning protein